MKNLNKIATAFCAAALGMLTLTGCEGSELYSIGAPDWISEKVDSIRNAQQSGEEEELEGMQEDVYTVGAADFSTGWWAAFSKYYQIPDGEKFHAVFNLSINPNASNTYKNFAMIITNDVDRGGTGYKEYGAIRYDNQPSGNSEWGDYIDRSLVESTLTFGSDTDKGVEKLGGRVVVTIDRTDPNVFFVKMDNGTVVKTYTQPTGLAALNLDGTNSPIRVFFVPEGSCINFLQANIEPIGGFTSAEDKQPVSMTLKGVPMKVLQGTSMEDAFANVTATVKFEQEVSKDVTAADLTFQTIPDMSSAGKKTLVAVYNKTYKGEGAAKPIMATADFMVVDKMYTCVGAADNSSPFFGERSALTKVAPGETFVSTFTNYNAGGANNWENFLVVLSKEDLSLGADGEYAVLRADNFGWGSGYGTCTPACSQTDWDVWRAAMNGAKVTTYVSNNGNGTADVKYDILGSDGQKYTQTYTGITVSDPNNFYMSFTIEKSHIEFDDVIGAEDNSSPFFGARSSLIQVPSGKTYTRRFINYNAGGANNWENFLVVLSKEDLTLGADGEYAVLRADNFGWGGGYGTCTPTCSHTDWDAWRTAMNGATVTVSVTNHGTTADVKCVSVGSDGNTYTQTYTGISTIVADNLWMSFTIEKAHLVFE